MKHFLRRPRKPGQGFSLVEMLVAMGLFSLITIILTTITTLGIRLSTSMSIRVDNLSQATTGMAQITKVVRTAVLPDQLTSQLCTDCASTAVVAASNSTIQFYANLNNTGNGPTLVTYQVVPDPSTTSYQDLLETMQPPTPQGSGKYSFCTPGPGCQVNKRIVARGLSSNPTIFTYYDFAGNPIAKSPLGAADLPSVDSIDVSLSIQTVIGGVLKTPGTTSIQRVQLPNADINVLVQPSPGATP